MIDMETMGATELGELLGKVDPSKYSLMDRQNPSWIALFMEYNKIQKAAGRFPLGMGCRPCYGTVYSELTNRLKYVLTKSGGAAD